MDALASITGVGVAGAASPDSAPVLPSPNARADLGSTALRLIQAAVAFNPGSEGRLDVQA